MALKQFSVDDILDDIKITNAKAKNEPLSDMQHIDDMIKDILTKRQENQLKEENRTISLREKKEMEEEIIAQTKSLTAEFKKLHKSLDKTLQPKKQPESVDALQSSLTGEIKLAAIHKEQKVKYRDTSEIEIPKEVKEKKEQKYQELKKVANNQHISQDMKSITSHFGNFKIDDESVDSSYAKTDITKANYQEFKSNRNKKIDEFVIEHKKQKSSKIEPELEVELLNEVELEQEPVLKQAVKPQKEEDFEQAELDTEYEYNDKSQTAEVSKNLIATKKSIKGSLVLLAVLSVISMGLFFTNTSAESMLIVGKFAISPAIYALINMGILLIASLGSMSIFSNAMSSLGEHKADKDLLYTLMMIVCFLANVAFCLKPMKLLTAGITLYTPIVVILLFINFLGKSLSIQKIIKNFEFISNEDEKYALTQVSDLKTAYDMTKGVVEGEPVLVKNIKVDFFQNFLANSFKSDLSDVIANRMALFSIPIILILAAFTYVLTKDIYLVISVASGTMLMLTGMIGALIVALPLHDTADVVSHFSGMMPEYTAIDTYKDTDAILVDANDLFPANAVVLHGIKTFQGKRIDDAIIDAASVLCSANSVLKGVFLSIINEKTELLRPVDSIIYEDLMGLSAWVAGKRVLIGNRDLMINHSIAVPKPEYESKYQQEGNEVVFLSCGGELCAAFIIQFQADHAASDVANLLHKNDLVAVIKTVDACVTGEMLGRVFDVEGALFKVLPSRLHRNFDCEMQQEEKVDSMLGNKGSLFGHIVSIVACQKLASCTRLGGVMYIVSAICGVLLLGAMALLKNLAIIGNLQMFIFMASFAVVYWIYEKNIKL
ncbi:MAG: hypothetical protein RR444_02965 [Oscillospiraceae bacterium]